MQWAPLSPQEAHSKGKGLGPKVAFEGNLLESPRVSYKGDPITEPHITV